MKDIIRVAHTIEAVCDNSGEITAKDKVDLLKYAVKSDILTTNEAIDLVCEYGIQLNSEETKKSVIRVNGKEIKADAIENRIAEERKIISRHWDMYYEYEARGLEHKKTARYNMASYHEHYLDGFIAALNMLGMNYER